MSRKSLAPQILGQILDHARQQDWRKGHHLPAQGLADTFRVSRAPVVAALGKLHEMGLVQAEANRGYFLARDGADLPVMEGEASAEEALYFQMAEDRLAGKLSDRLSENELMRIYGAARGRLTKVLHRIAEEGWIERLPGNGWQFRESLTSPKAYADAYLFRAATEKQALLLPSFRIDPAAFAAQRQHQEALLRSYAGDSRSEIFVTNVEFHEMLMTCANNDFFLDAVRRVNRVRRLMEYRITNDRSRLPQQSREHLQILDLIETGDMEKAAEFLFRHISNAGTIKTALLN